MLRFNQKLTCLFCFKSFKAQNIQYRCYNPKCHGHTSDMIYAHEHGELPRPMGNVISGKKRLFSLRVARHMSCDLCKEKARALICPTCHHELPQGIGEIDQKVIAIVGGRSAGKSIYIASLIYRLQHGVGRRFGFAIALTGDGTYERWIKQYIQLVEAEDPRVLQMTSEASVNPGIKTPLLCRLTFNNGKKIRELYIGLFDISGEDMAKMDIHTLASEAPYICNADGLIVLLDPLQMKSLRQQLQNVPPLNQWARPEFIVERLRELFESFPRFYSSQKIRIPVAFALSKVDLLKNIVGPSDRILDESPHSGKLDLGDVREVNDLTDNYLRTWINDDFLAKIDNKFAKKSFFSVSSLGRQPDPSGRVRIKPLRVEDPFLWVLHRFKLVKGKKRG